MESVSIEEIRDLALIYIDESECGAQIRKGDAFALLVRKVPTFFGKKKEDKWLFGGYGILLDYLTDPNEKPYGKWITMKYLSLATFPPSVAEIKLQPPHIAKGYFQSFDRASETKIVPINLETDENKKEDDEPKEAEILQFPGVKKE